MEATVIEAGGVNPGLLVTQMITPFKDPRLMDYMQQQFQDLYSKIQGHASVFANKAKQIFDFFQSNVVANRAKELLQNTSTIVRDDIIQCFNYDTIQDAGWLTRRYIMANPDLWHLYVNNRCDGWNDEWVVEDRELPAEDRLDYMHAMDGVLQFDEEGNGFFRFYSTDVENPLNLSERLCIKQLWDIAENVMANGIDPTDKNRNKL
jgi:hypothetical protein